jgi:hypothetical protein
MITLQKRLRRGLLFGASLFALGAPAIASGCGGGFDPISLVNKLRVLAVVADKPYADPGDDVTFHMTYYDGYIDPKDPNGPGRNVQVLWLGGCFNPIGDQYYGCYESLAELFQSLTPGKPPPPDLLKLVGFGDTFTLKLPADLITRRPRPPSGPYYGLAYVFFAVCAGTIKPVPPDGTGRAGSFPLGCFDANGKRLGAESFVPGYTQVYSFEDGRPNTNPVLNALTLDGEPVPEGIGEELTIGPCDIPADSRNGPVACGQKDPNTDCKSIQIDVDVPANVAEVDPQGMSLDNKPIFETVWVDYFAEKGSFDSGIQLVSEATAGITKDHSSHWVPPAEPGRVSLWAVVHDSRGGSAVIQRYVMVK